jgi:hypothetical protein
MMVLEILRPKHLLPMKRMISLIPSRVMPWTVNLELTIACVVPKNEI